MPDNRKSLELMSPPELLRLVQVVRDSQFSLGGFWEGDAKDLLHGPRLKQLCQSLWDEYRADPDVLLLSEEWRAPLVAALGAPIVCDFGGAKSSTPPRVSKITNPVTGTMMDVVYRLELTRHNVLLLTTNHPDPQLMPFFPFGVLHTEYAFKEPVVRLEALRLDKKHVWH